MTRNRLRTFLVVFLTVLLGGLGVSGAAALWSQSGAVKTTVTTGSWVDYTRPGWSLPITVNAQRMDYSVLLGRYDFRFTWSPEKAPDTTDPVEYVVTLESTDNGKVISSVPVTVKSSSRTVDLSVQRIWFREADFRLSITPVIKGVAGTPTVKTLSTTTWGGYGFG